MDESGSPSGPGAGSGLLDPGDGSDGRGASALPSIADRLAAAAATSCVGRDAERERLSTLLDGTAAVVFVHGPGGIGKTALVSGTLASSSRRSIRLDGRAVEPTVTGALAALSGALGIPTTPSVADVAAAVAAARIDTIVVDSFERLNLLDGWLRNDVLPALPASVTVVLVSRRGPNAAWLTAPGWRTLIDELVVGPMSRDDVDRLLAVYGVAGDDAAAIASFCRGHPLAAVAAADARGRHRGPASTSGAPAEVVEELFTSMLDDLPPHERAVVEAAAVLRRVTVPLLAAVLDGDDVDAAWRVLTGLPFTSVTPGGIELSGVAAAVLLEALELRDPVRVRRLRARAAVAVLDSLSDQQDWPATADLLHLVQNPLIRNAYAPPGQLQHPAEVARPTDATQVLDIVRRFAGDESARLAQLWWQARPGDFAVVRDTDGSVAGASVTTTADRLAGTLTSDPAVRSVVEHLRRHPLPAHRPTTLVFRWALGRRSGERPSPDLATLVVDLKRSYLELRATLGRVYTVVAEWATAAPVLEVMGFRRVDAVTVGDRPFVVAALDFGPRGVDAWIGRHVLAEQAPAAPPPADGGSDGVDVPAPESSVLTVLTAREREVLMLLAEGRSNTRLAEALFISERTANRHVSNIFTKLGVHNRTQAARLAVLAGLAP